MIFVWVSYFSLLLLASVWVIYWIELQYGGRARDLQMVFEIGELCSAIYRWWQGVEDDMVYQCFSLNLRAVWDAFT